MNHVVPMPAGRVVRLMVYDGYCHLCSGWSQFMSRHPIDPPFTHLTMQSETGRKLLLKMRPPTAVPCTGVA